MPQQPNQQNFLHLRNQMQATPLPGQQPQQAMGTPNQGLPQNLTQNQQQQFQANLEQQRAQQNAPGRPGGSQQLSAQDNALVQELTNRLMGQVGEEEKINLRNNLQQRLEPSALQRYQAQGVDPVHVYFRNQALTRLRNEKQARMTQQAQQQIAMGQQPQNMPSGAPPMQPQRSVNPSPLPGQAQPPTSMSGNPDFGSFMGNMENLAAQQQQQGVMAEQAGQMVVPASGAPRNGTPQPGVMAGPPNNMNGQGNVPNPGARAQQQQQMLHAQQMQQQRLHQTMQQQSQAQARLNAQAKAQQMGLQGQHGGLGPGPVPPQQSPAMATLNAPMRTPSQQMNHPETPQVNPAAKFGAPLDPRFMQGNQRQPGQGNGMGMAGINQETFNSMGPQMQQQIATLPPDKLQEVMSKWNEARAAQGMQMQNGRPQMPMQGNPQVRPGQQIQQPFNVPNPANQFGLQNPGQRAPPSMVNGMNPTQQMVLAQQMANMRPNQMQQRGMTMTQESQQLAAQMDQYPIPPVLHNHASMPQGIPPEIKKWGQLKQWTMQNAQNLGLPQNSLDAVKQLQSMHYRQLLQMKRQQQTPGGNMPPGPQGPQPGNPTIPPGMAAPVAPMGPNPMQMQNGMNVPLPGQIRPPTQQEIHNIRNHQSGKMAGATDDQIRALFMRNMQNQQAQAQQQMTPQQQQRQQMMQQLQLQRMQQANSQQNHQQPPQPQQQPNAQPQAKPAPVAPPKQPQQTAETASSTANNANANRSARPQQNAKSQAQNSSPAQPAKNLKRASSDDVVEVPNPNAQQARPAQAPAQTPNQPSQMRVPLTPAQVASLNPDHRKKYEQMLQLSQASMASRTMQVDPAMQEKLENIKKEERDKFRDSHQDIPMDEATRKQTAMRIMQIVGPLTNVGKILSRWFQITLDEETARNYCRAVSYLLSDCPSLHLLIQCSVYES